MRGRLPLLLACAVRNIPFRALAGGPPADMVIEDFTDIVTPLDRSWNDFQGNRVGISPEFSVVSLRVSSDRSALNLKWDFRGTNTAPPAADYRTGPGESRCPDPPTSPRQIPTWRSSLLL